MTNSTVAIFTILTVVISNSRIIFFLSELNALQKSIPQFARQKIKPLWHYRKVTMNSGGGCDCIRSHSLHSARQTKPTFTQNRAKKDEPNEEPKTTGHNVCMSNGYKQIWLSCTQVTERQHGREKKRDNTPNTHLLETCLIWKLLPALIFYTNVYGAAAAATKTAATAEAHW